MADLQLTTLQIPGVAASPPQIGNPSEYFGEQSNDLQLNEIGDFSTISGSEKLQQDINKIFLTEKGKNLFFAIYGTSLQSLVGAKVDLTNARARLRVEMEDALEVLLFINTDNPNDDEVPAILESLSVEEIAIGQFEVRISVISRSGKRVSSDTILVGA
jgi:hypothetical protein